MDEDRDRALDHTECPLCHSYAVRLESESHGFFWKCQGRCETFFDDGGGELVPPVECPVCKKYSLERFCSKKLPGVFFWRCKPCESFYADQHGFPGERFGDLEAAPCPGCGGKVTRQVYIDGPLEGEWRWRCESCGDFRDADGQIGAPFDETLQ